MKKSSKAFFSILLPTRNRHEYLNDSIQSVLMQGFKSFELIISDNQNDEKTVEILNKYISNSCIKIIRPDVLLAMPDNWEFALKQASGEYVLVLPDRKLLFKDALQNVYNGIVNNNYPKSCSFCVKVYDDINKHMGWFPPEVKLKKKERLFDTNLLVNNFLNKKYLSPKSLDFYFPKSLNGCFHKSLVEKAWSTTGHFFNNEFATTPDYSSFFIQMALTKKVLFIGTPIYLSQGEIVSNGRYSSVVDCMPYLKTLAFDNYYKYVDVRVPYIYNLLLNDFLCIQDKFKGSLETFEINKTNYFASLMFDLERIKSVNLMSKDNVKQYTNGLFSIFETEDDTIKKKTMERLSEIKKEDKNNLSASNTMMLHVRDYIRHNFTHWKLINKFMKYKFETALEAAGFKNID
jgi:glycosyltransferase involved in cell wall biosynthesis